MQSSSYCFIHLRNETWVRNRPENLTWQWKGDVQRHGYCGSLDLTSKHNHKRLGEICSFHCEADPTLLFRYSVNATRVPSSIKPQSDTCTHAIKSKMFILTSVIAATWWQRSKRESFHVVGNITRRGVQTLPLRVYHANARQNTGGRWLLVI
jgi:hypothetical protein